MKVSRSALFLLVLAGCGGSARPDGSGSTVVAEHGRTNATVVRVVDGDTIDADFDGTTERVRLIGIDTPETKKPDTPVECFGPEASARTAAALPRGAAIRVERDVEARDDYGRLLAYVYAADGTFVNLALVADGYAQPLTIAPNDTFAADFVAAAREAERAGRGLWGSCNR